VSRFSLDLSEIASHGETSTVAANTFSVILCRTSCRFRHEAFLWKESIMFKLLENLCGCFYFWI